MTGFKSEVEAIQAGRRAPASYDASMGFQFRSLGPGRAVVDCPDTEAFQNPTGVVHGGLYFGLADSAIAYAVSTMLESGETCTTIESSIRFLRPHERGPVRAEARILRAGRTVCVAECDLADGAGRSLAKVTSTFLRLSGAAGGRWLKDRAAAPE